MWGQRSLAMATDIQSHAAFFSGAQVRSKADHYARPRKSVQHTGTRSATRRLVVLAGRERRARETGESDGRERRLQQRNHRISRQIVDASPHSLIGWDDWTHSRERRKRTHGKRARAKQRRAHRQASQWAVAERQGLPALWAHRRGQPPTQGAAVQLSGVPAGSRCRLDRRANMALRTLLARQDWVRAGVLSERPEVASEETKAARRRCAAEVRWSLDASSRA
jgi:hypothetical protein